MSGYARVITTSNHPLDVAGLTHAVKEASYAVDYKKTSGFVHCSQAALSNYFPKEGAPYVVCPSSGEYEQPCQSTLFIVLIYLHSAICYVLYGLEVDRPENIGKLFQEALIKMEPYKKLHSKS